MNEELIVVGEVHQDLYYESNFYEDLVKKIIDNLINFIRFNPDDLINRRLLTKIIKSSFSETPKKIMSTSQIKRGGNGNNSAEFLANLGIPVKLISVIGKDSNWIIDELKKNQNINTEYIFRIEEKTPISTIIKSDFTTKIYLAPNLKEKMTFQGIKVDGSLLEGGKLILITPIAEKFKPILEKILELNPIIAANIEYQKIQNSEQLSELIKEKLDLIFINLDDAKLIFGDEDLEDLDSKLCNYSKIRIYTEGKNGSYIFSDLSSIFFIPTQEVKVIDRTGAGDCYAAGFLTKFHQLFKDKSYLQKIFTQENKDELLSKLKECGNYATYSAMYKVSHQNSPTKDELEGFITQLDKN